MQHHEYVVYQTTPPQQMHTLQPHQPMTQSIQQVHHQPIPQPIPQSMNQSMPQTSNGEIMMPVKQTMSQPYDPALHQHHQPIHQAPPQTLTCRCPNCQLLLSFPSGIPYISCPKCQASFQPISAPYSQPMMQQPITHPVQQPISQPPSMMYTTCPQCSTLLSHPVTSTQIQCPNCQSILEVPPPMNQPNQPPLGSPAPKHQSHHHKNKDPSNSSSSHSTPQTRPSKDQDRERSSNNHRHSNAHPPSSSEPIDPATGLPNKKRKDPNAPKRASNAYMIFCKERRAQLKNDRPDLPFGQLGKRLGEIWRSMSEQEKEVYELRACGDRDRYKGQMSEYQSFEMMKNVGVAPAKGQSNNDDSASIKPQTQSTKRKRVSRPKKRPHSDDESERSGFDDESDQSDSDADHSNNHSNRRKRASHRSSSSQSSHQSS